jgi:YfiH family protein
MMSMSFYDQSYMTLPAVPDAFYWTDEAWGAALRCGPLDAIAPHLFTTRQSGSTSPADLERLAAAVGARELAMVTQVHGAAVVVVRRDVARPDGKAIGAGQGRQGDAAQARLEGDVLVSNSPDVAIAVRAADCVPLLLGDARTGAVAAVHAGWRGTAVRAAVAALEALTREFGTRPSDMVAAIGPSIGPCCYEVGPELVDAFAAAGHERYLIERWFPATRALSGVDAPARGLRDTLPLRLDIAAANRDQLILAGVPERSVHASGLCTAMHLDVLTSYRAEKERAGRIAGVIRARA